MTEITLFFTEHWLAVGVGMFLVVMTLYGHYRGFIRLSVSVSAMVLALVIVNMAMPQIEQLLEKETVVHQWLGEKMTEAAGLGEIPAEAGEAPDIQRQVIEELNLPDKLKEQLINHNNSQIYERLGVEVFAEYIGTYLARMVFHTVGYAVLYMIVYMILRLMFRWLDLMAKLPVLHGLNHIAGACLGLAEGVLLVWLGCLILPAFSGTDWGMAAMEQIAETDWLLFLYKMNVFPRIAGELLLSYIQ